jgi:Ser/Thr protein kinase RdoA (MazF antagonist)
VAEMGFSGTTLARVRPCGTDAWFVLKAFAAGTPRGRAEWVHTLVRHLARSGVVEMPPPVPAPDGDTLATDATGCHWELVPFIAGAATECPSAPQAAAALAALARLHVAAATLPGEPRRRGPAPAVERRVAQAQDLAARPWRLRRAAAAEPGPDHLRAAVADRRGHACAIFNGCAGARALAQIASHRPAEVPLGPVLRDVWSAHVLFAQDAPTRVAGIIDPHAASIDTPATDIARLLGSWHRDDARSIDPVAAWPEAIAAYAAVRPLAEEERRLVPFLHAAGVICSLDNWFRWMLEDRRTFTATPAALARIDRLLADLPAALDFLATEAPGRV